MTAIPGVGKLVTGAALGVAAGGAVGVFAGDKLGGPKLRGDEHAKLEAERNALREELRAGTESGELTVGQVRALEAKIEEMNRQVDSKSWPAVAAVGVGGAVALTARHLDHKTNFRWDKTPGWQSDWYGFGSDGHMVRGPRLRFGLTPGLMFGAAAALPAAVLGATIVNNIRN